MDPIDITTRKILTPTESKVMVDAFLSPLLQQLTEEARRMSPHYETLWQDIQKLYNAGGKRLRSYMTLLVFESFSRKPIEAILPAAAALELVHLALLVHDDIIDRDTIRYGVKNVAGSYLDHYEELIDNNNDDRRHHANSAAVLAGDLLFSEAYLLVTETQVDPSIILKTQRLVSKAMFRVIGGELLDTEASFRGADAADPALIAEQKTASYSFVNPFLTGAVLAEAPQLQQEILQKIGEQLGIAYQLRDDILGVFGDEAKTGKSTEGDLREGKRTFLIQEFEKHATIAQQKLFHTFFGHNNITGEGITVMKDLLVKSGAKEAVETMIEAYTEHTRTLLASLDIDESHRDTFNTLIDLCVHREK